MWPCHTAPDCSSVDCFRCMSPSAKHVSATLRMSPVTVNHSHTATNCNARSIPRAAAERLVNPQSLYDAWLGQNHLWTRGHHLELPAQIENVHPQRARRILVSN